MLEGGPVHKAFSSCVDPDPRPCPMLKCHPPPRRHLTLNPTLHKFHPCLNSTPHSQGLFFFFFFLLFGWGSVLPCCCWFIYIFIFSNKSIIFLILFYSLYFVIVLLFLACSLPPFFFFFLLWFCFKKNFWRENLRNRGSKLGFRWWNNHEKDKIYVHHLHIIILSINCNCSCKKIKLNGCRNNSAWTN